MCRLLVALLALPAIGLAQQPGTNFAFLVSCGEKYNKAQLNPLPKSFRDMDDFRKALLGTGFEAENIVFLHDRTEKPEILLPEKDKILRQLELLLDLVESRDTLVVALNGHGLHFAGDKTSYFCPLNAKINDKKTMIPMSGDGGLFTILKGCKAKRKLLIVGACRNDPANSTQADTKIDLDLFDPDVVPEGIAALYSCKAGQKTYFEEKQDRSYFFDHLVRAWQGEYHPADEQISLESVFEKVKTKTSARVREEYNESQVPDVRREYQGEWLVRQGRPATPEPKKPEPLTVQNTGNRTLEQAINLLAKDIKKGLGDARPEASLGSFEPDLLAYAAAYSTVAPEIIRLLTLSLEPDVKMVRGRARFVISGTFVEAEDAKTGMVVLRLDVVLVDREAGRQSKFSQLVTNQISVQKFLGISNETPPGATVKQRHAALAKEVLKFHPSSADKPKPVIDKFAVLAAKDSPFAIEVHSVAAAKEPNKSREMKDHAGVEPTDNDGLAFVKIDKGHVFGVKLVNNGDFDAAVSLHIDGMNMFEGCDKEMRDPKGQPKFRFMIVSKKSSIFIPGWFLNLRESASFSTVEYPKQLADSLLAPAGREGGITACFHAAVPKDQPFPPGEPTNPDDFSQSGETSKGDRLTGIQQIEMKTGVLRATVGVRYKR